MHLYMTIFQHLVTRWDETTSCQVITRQDKKLNANIKSEQIEKMVFLWVRTFWATWCNQHFKTSPTTLCNNPPLRFSAWKTFSHFLVDKKLLLCWDSSFLYKLEQICLFNANIHRIDSIYCKDKKQLHSLPPHPPKKWAAPLDVI